LAVHRFERSPTSSITALTRRASRRSPATLIVRAGGLAPKNHGLPRGTEQNPRDLVLNI